MAAYYNEIDPYCAQWLRNLITAGHIAPGDVDTRSIVDVRADDLKGYDQCHFFAGIGGWSLALRLAGWDDARPAWTGSCPCQPFSAAGKGQAADDERHLAPAWLSLIAESRPAIVFGEQVEAAIGWGWLDFVFNALEAEGYACGAAVLPACGVGAPHIRQRVYFVADSSCERRQQIGRSASSDEATDGPARRIERESNRDHVAGRDGEASTVAHTGLSERRPPDAGRHDDHRQDALGSQGAGGTRERSRSGGMADSDGRHASAEGLQRGGQHGQQPQDGGAHRMADAGQGGRGSRKRHICEARRESDAGRSGETGVAQGDAIESRLEGHTGHGDDRDQPGRQREDAPRSTATTGRAGFWSDVIWLPCRDGKARPTKPGIFPLAHGVPARVGKLRAAGNAISPQVAEAFIRACEVRPS